jgi:Fic family protein
MRNLTPIIGLGIFAFLFISILVVCLSIFKRSSKQIDQVQTDLAEARKRKIEKDREENLFALAETQGGAVTAVEVARHTDMTLSEATAYLESLVKEGVAERDVSESGAITYRIVLT